VEIDKFEFLSTKKEGTIGDHREHTNFQMCHCNHNVALLDQSRKEKSNSNSPKKEG